MRLATFTPAPRPSAEAPACPDPISPFREETPPLPLGGTPAPPFHAGPPSPPFHAGTPVPAFPPEPDQEEARCGVVDAGAKTVRPLPQGVTVLGLLRDGTLQDAEQLAGAPIPLDEVRLLAPLQPPGLRDFMTFEEHIEGVRMGVPGRSEVPRRGTRPRRSTSPTRTPSSARTTTCRCRPAARRSTSSWRSRP